MQGKREERANTEVWGYDLPFSHRTLFVQHNYRAKFGVEGKDVSISEVAPDQYLVSVPEFTFIGHDEVAFKTALEDGGVLKWTTPDIDTAEIVTEILNDEQKLKQIDANRDLLEEQAQDFYLGIINGIDSNAVVEFEFHKV